MDIFQVLLFPGVLFHEFAHYFSCKLMGVKVTRVKFTSVTHSRPSPWKSFAISFAPFLLGNVAGFVSLFVGHTGLRNAGDPATTMQVVSIGLFYWLGVSLLAYSFASEADARNAVEILIDFYRERLLLKHGALSGIFWFFTIPFLFLPFLFFGFVMLLFSTVKGLGLAWSVIIFLALGFWMGVW